MLVFLSVLERGVVGAQEVTRKAWTNIEATSSSIDVSYSRESITPDVVSCLEILDLRIILQKREELFRGKRAPKMQKMISYGTSLVRGNTNDTSEAGDGSIVYDRRQGLFRAKGGLDLAV